jgi:hypothetical protein
MFFFAMHGQSKVKRCWFVPACVGGTGGDAQ